MSFFCFFVCFDEFPSNANKIKTLGEKKVVIIKERSISFDDEEKKEFRLRLKSLMQGRTLDENAKRWGVKKSDINNYLYRGSVPRLAKIKAIADVEGVDLEWLLLKKCPSFKENTDMNDKERDEKIRQPNAIDVHASLLRALESLSEEEQIALAHLFSRKGVEIALLLLDEQNRTLIQLPETLKEHIITEYVTGDKQKSIADNNVCAPAEEERHNKPNLTHNHKRAI
ncbi:hypothetical protein AAH678_03535 [Sodalis endosymbiont of Spalangia cameroni]|uniref:hypothetical protein n=1 Tax=Sodalis praecaptivus TaxID=1239307 RepID=UPI0031F90774